MAAAVAGAGKGLYVSPDGVFYVGTARNLLQGRGFTPPPGLPPVGHFPPLFTLALAAVGRSGLDPLAAARVVNMAALGAIVLLVGVVLRSRTGSVAAALAGATAAAAAVDLLSASTSALSEPLFVVLALTGLVVLAHHLERGRSVWSLVAAGALVGAACLTRYVGVALVLAGVAGLLRFGDGRRWHGAADAGAFAGLGVAPTFGFLAWAAGAKGAAGDRTVAWHAFGRDYLAQVARPLARWVLPWATPPLAVALGAGVVVAATVLIRRTPPSPPPSSARPSPVLPWLLGVFAGSYLVVVVLNRLLTDATGRLDGRFLAPLHVVAILMVVPVLHRRRAEGTAAVTAVAALAAAVLAAQVAGAGAWVAGGLSDTGTGRRGYTAAAWRRSPVMAFIAANHGRLPVYSNAFDAVAFLTPESAQPVPAKKDYLTGRPNPAYARKLAELRSALASSGGYLAYFDAATSRRSFLPSRAELERDLPLVPVLHDAVGTVYRSREAPP